MRRKKFFTIAIRVFLFLAIALLLIAILLPSLATVREDSPRTLCATNLSGIAKAMYLYASQYNDHLPIFPTPSNLQWLCDESPQVMSAVLNVGPTSSTPDSAKRRFYCPQNAAQNPEKMFHWNNTSVTGYIFLNERGEGAKNIRQDLAKLAPPPSGPALDRDQPLHYVSEVNSPHSDQIVLAADWIVSADTAPSTNTGNPKIIRPGPPNLTLNSSHTLRRTHAAGGNVLTADSSVHWRTFSPTTATPIKQPGPINIYFWIPANQ